MTFAMMECFMVAVETLNFTVAASKVHITQPAFSRNIATMESEVGYPLFWRSKQSGIRVTPAGLELYKGIKQLETDLKNVFARAGRINRGEEGELAIGIMNGMCIDGQTMKSIHSFRKKYPAVNISLRSYNFNELIKGVEDGEIDICFSVEGAVKNKEELLFEQVVYVDNYLCVPASANCEEGQCYSLCDFKDYPVLISEDATDLNNLFIDSCEKAGFKPNTLMAPNYETKMMWVEIGKGIAVNSKEHYLKNSPNVKFVKVKEINPDGYGVIWQKENYNPAIALFCSTFEETSADDNN